MPTKSELLQQHLDSVDVEDTSPSQPIEEYSFSNPPPDSSDDE
jgi:hypothetical protein